ncbi:MAG: hypothetical protein JST54_16685 [Deltaproteobacteria bacterium]|nr:hypothetical protein [Deltaproteobacteria bacterium]
MRRLALAMIALCGCGGEPSGGPQMPIALTIQGVAPSSVAELQVILAAPSSKFDPLSHQNTCTKTWIPADQTLQLTGADGKQHPSQVIPISGTGTQNATVTGIPPAKQVLLVVEAIDSSHKLVGIGFKAPIDQINAGDNPAVSVTVTGIDPVDCGGAEY